MPSSKAVFVLCVEILLLFTGCDNAWCDGTISGQVFVVTQGGQNLKLGDVEVALYPYDAVVSYVEKRKAKSDDLSSKLRSFVEPAGQEKVNVALGYAQSGLFFVEGLHDPLSSTRTDADGNYSLTVPSRGKFVLTARAMRKTFDSLEAYCWLVAVSASADKVTVNLANANMTSGGSADSLVNLTVDSASEALAIAGREFAPKILQEAKDDADRAEAQRIADEKALAAKQAAYIRSNLPQLVKASQARALAGHPDLGKAGSDINKKFVADFQHLQAVHDPLLNDPGWPEKLVGDTPPPIAFPNFAPPPSPQATPTATAAVIWNCPMPPYPAAARAAHITGTTTVDYTTDASGHVSTVSITQSAGNALLDHFTQVYVKEHWTGPPSSSHSTTFEYRLH